jgi:MerR family transcriptional regulator/heat shock protein HspR
MRPRARQADGKERVRRPLYMISVVADMLKVHPQTLRTYEREGLLRPSRTEGNTRLYSDEDVERVELILRLTKELGVNLAGVEVILNMRDRMEGMQRQMNQAMEAFLRRFQAEFRDLGVDENQEGLVPVGRRGLTRRAPRR